MVREIATDLSVLERLGAPAGKDVVDIGCGGGGLARRGARVTGVEVSAGQLAAARAHAQGPERAGEVAPTYLIGAGEALPVDDGSADLAVFMRTLHHVPPAVQGQALREARRVLRPGGLVYVAEPLAEGEYFALMSLVEDELEVRRAAQAALAKAGEAGLEPVDTVEYDVRFCLPEVDAFRARNVSVNPERAAVFDDRAQEIAETFARLGEPGERPGERYFRQPMRADLLRRAEG